MPDGADRDRQITRERAHIRALAAGHQKGGVVIVDHFVQGEGLNQDRPGREFDRLIVAGQIIGPLALNLDRGITGRNLLDHLIGMLPQLLESDGVAYIMQISMLSQEQTERLIRQAGYQVKVVDFSLYSFSPVFLENLEQIHRVESASDAYHFSFQDEHVMGMYLLEVRAA